MTLNKRDAAVIWHPYTQHKTPDLPIAICSAKGAYIYDEKGQEYIDAIASWWVNIHGHSHPLIAERVYQQFQKLEHVMFAGFTHFPAIELAEKLLEKLPKNLGKIFYSDNGSTAVEVAIKMAIQYWYNKGITKTKIIAFKNGYHGDTFGAMSVSSRDNFTKPFIPFLFDVEFIDLPLKNKEAKSVKQLTELAESGNVAAFIFEPLVQGAAGMVMYSPSILEELLGICSKHNILTIADEVFTGFGRTGKFFAIDHLQKVVDIVCLSKGITAGALPLGVTACTNEIFNEFVSGDKAKTFFHGHSFTANPLACAAALANLELFENPIVFDDIKRIEKKHEQFIKSLHGFKKTIRELRKLGTILAIEISSDDETGYFNELKDYIYPFFIQRKIVIRPLGNIIYIVPPYCISDKDLDTIYSAIKECLTLLKNGTLKSNLQQQWVNG
ncbi:MAG: adenosylmethionine--8-amino-7-oxononanoate transaminase [Bacteroidetes bacterium]|nr:adenosylmethionine--8-amino-7-oxononanoate transaminase [Bacteroidota bacterium]HET6245294.1 adenosylmethionine--8-amino-7-oxononanoate transaminase [Bacteroidia bacterium]